ncbi:MAG: hypothetical protein R3C53_18065 [Pirellulaceae bacterium]
MDTVACLVGGAALIACAVGLTYLRPPNWQEDGELLDEHQRAIEYWARVQRVVRQLNNGLLGIIGGAIMASVFVPRGRVWMLLWGVILVMLLICILFAMIDAFSSMASYRRALPEAARRSFAEIAQQSDHSE